MRTLGYIWSAPVTLLALLLAIIYIPKSIRWSEGCIEIIPVWMAFAPLGQAIGWVVFYRDKACRRSKWLRVHERVHVEQCFKGSVFFLLAYVCNFLVWFVNPPATPAGLKPQKRWRRAYMKIYWEVIAYRVQDRYLHGELPNAWGANP